MKSAYELAMERLNAEDPKSATPLSDAQKDELAEVGKKYQAKIAEREIFLQKQLSEARANGDYVQETQMLKQLASEKALLQEEMDIEKNKIRGESC